MIEELITSGRMNPGIDPVLHAWGWEVPLYLFLGGLSGGILIFASWFYSRGQGDQFPTAVKRAPLAVPFLIGFGLIALILDLSHPAYFWQLFTNIRWESPMSWGAWTLTIITPIAILWCATWLEELFPRWDWRYQTIQNWVNWLKERRKILAYLLLPMSIVLGMYTGILLSAFNARPFWNTAIMGPLFLTSGLTAGAASIAYFSKEESERRVFNQIVLVLIAIEGFLLIHLFMGLLAGTEVHIQAAELFLGGKYTTKFWLFDVMVGLAFPAILKLLELQKKNIPALLPFVMIIFGNLMLRFTVVEAGQASRWLY